MKKAAWLLILVVAGLVGCQSSPPAPTAANIAPTSTLGAPTHRQETNIALVRQGKTVTIGMRGPEAFDVFRDAREGGFEDDRLPPGFAAPYRARSWESSQRGFGVITYQDGVVAAMYQEHDCTLDQMQKWVDVHAQQMNRGPDQRVISKRLNYYFWEEGGQRLMILGFQKKATGMVELTMAMGDTDVLDAIGASPDRANFEKDRVDRLLTGESETVAPATQEVRKG